MLFFKVIRISVVVEHVHYTRVYVFNDCNKILTEDRRYKFLVFVYINFPNFFGIYLQLPFMGVVS